MLVLLCVVGIFYFSNFCFTYLFISLDIAFHEQDLCLCVLHVVYHGVLLCTWYFIVGVPRSTIDYILWYMIWLVWLRFECSVSYYFFCDLGAKCKLDWSWRFPCMYWENFFFNFWNYTNTQKYVEYTTILISFDKYHN